MCEVIILIPFQGASDKYVIHSPAGPGSLTRNHKAEDPPHTPVVAPDLLLQ